LFWKQKDGKNYYVIKDRAVAALLNKIIELQKEEKEEAKT